MSLPALIFYRLRLRYRTMKLRVLCWVLRDLMTRAD
jgi:hypothetical protein